jgi:hypothetical protein
MAKETELVDPFMALVNAATLRLSEQNNNNDERTKAVAAATRGSKKAASSVKGFPQKLYDILADESTYCMDRRMRLRVSMCQGAELIFAFSLFP